MDQTSIFGWKVSNDVIFTTFVTISIFVLGYIANRLYDKYKKRRELNSLKEYFCCLVQLLDEPINKQADSFAALSRRLKAKTGGDMSLAHITSFNLDNLNNVAHYDLYSIFLKGKRKKNIQFITVQFQKVQSAIYLLKAIRESYTEDYSAFFSKYQAHEKIWNENVSSIMSVFVQYSNTIAEKKAVVGSDAFVEELISLVNAFLASPNNKEMDVIKKKLLEPLNDLCGKHLGDKRVLGLLDKTSSCTSAYENTVKIQRAYRRKFLLLARKMITAKHELNYAVNALCQY